MADSLKHKYSTLVSVPHSLVKNLCAYSFLILSGCDKAPDQQPQESKLPKETKDTVDTTIASTEDLNLQYYDSADSFLSIYPGSPQISADLIAQPYKFEISTLPAAIQKALPKGPQISRIHLYNSWENGSSEEDHIAIYERRSNQFFVYGDTHYTNLFEKCVREHLADISVTLLKISLYRIEESTEETTWTVRSIKGATLLNSSELPTYLSNSKIELQWSGSGSLRINQLSKQNESVHINSLSYVYFDSQKQQQIHFESSIKLENHTKSNITVLRKGAHTYLLELSYKPVDTLLEALPQL